MTVRPRLRTVIAFYGAFLELSGKSRCEFPRRRQPEDATLDGSPCPGGGMADTTVSNTVAERHAGSSPAPGTARIPEITPPIGRRTEPPTDGKVVRMDDVVLDESVALALLGVSRGAPLAELRRRYRAELRASHPDVNSSPEAAQRTRALIDAFVLLNSLQIATPEIVIDTTVDARPTQRPFAELLDDETVVVDAPSDESFRALVLAGQEFGVVTYVDRQAELLEVLLTTTRGDAISLVVTLQGRSNGTTEAFLTLEPLNVNVPERDVPSVRAIALLIVHNLVDAHRFGQ
jgi:hypothetical protein